MYLSAVTRVSPKDENIHFLDAMELYIQTPPNIKEGLLEKKTNLHTVLVASAHLERGGLGNHALDHRLQCPRNDKQVEVVFDGMHT
jgi:hypothetical protein